MRKIFYTSIHSLRTDKGNFNFKYLAPSRELACGIYDIYDRIGIHMKKYGLQIVQCVAGTSLGDVRNQLFRGPQVVVGTPGRVDYMTSTKSLDLSAIRVVIIDEAFFR